MTRSALVTGGGGFIGHHMVARLKAEGCRVRAVDISPPEFEESAADAFDKLDLREPSSCSIAVEGVQDVYHLAADMGGIGFISGNHADVARNNLLIDLHMLQAAHEAGVERFFYSSSACIYPLHLQHSPEIGGLKEEDAWPAEPEEGYGLEKLYAEKLCEYYRRDKGLDTRVARFHNVYGPLGTYDGGREKAPAAICRKVALAKDGGEIEIWGDGRQTRSFMYVDDCVEGILRLMGSDYSQPLNLGTDRMVTVDQLVDIVSQIAGKTLEKVHDTSQPQGVRGRNSDNSRLREVLGWEPEVSLEDGLRHAYLWIEQQLSRSHA